MIIIFCLYAPAQGFYQPVISGFAEGCPLESADGLQTGDRLVSIDGERVYIYSDVSLLLGLNKTGTFDLVVDRGGEKVYLDDFAMTRQTYTDQKRKCVQRLRNILRCGGGHLRRQTGLHLEQCCGFRASGAAEPTDALVPDRRACGT